MCAPRAPVHHACETWTGGSARIFEPRIVEANGTVAEWRFQFRPERGADAAIELAVSTDNGGAGLRVTRTQLFPRQYGKPVTQASFPIHPLPGWNALRWVRPPNSRYAFAYLNGELVAPYMKLSHGPPRAWVALGAGLNELPTDPAPFWPTQATHPGAGYGIDSDAEFDCLRVAPYLP
jgi:hypothetical protein